MTPGPGPSEDQRKRCVTDFVFGKVIGEGSYSTVYLAKDVSSSKEVAIKVLEKQHIKKEKKIQYVTREKEGLLRLNGTGGFFVKLYCTFQDSDRLYFCMSYAKNGELLKYISEGVLNLDCARYYTAEMVLALEVLRSKGIIHRDFKPENILLDENWHILITDFGSAKLLSNDDDQNENIEDENAPRRRNSFVGTAQYVSPEMLTDTHATYASDLWALGCIIFQMVAGSFPFKAPNDYLIFQKILKADFEFPAAFDPAARDLVQKLLVLDAVDRLGAQDSIPYRSIREHAFFEGAISNWDNLGTPPKMNKTLEGPNDATELLNSLEPGLDEEKVSRLQLDLLICNSTTTNNTPPSPTEPLTTNNSMPPAPSITPNVRKKSQAVRNIIAELTEEDIAQRVKIQQSSDPYHGFVEGNLILKQGFIDKRKGLFARKRMFLLTLGPHLYYVDPVAMILKGEIPWSGGELRTEAKNFKTFFVHTPNRTYYLEDQNGYALEWCKCIDEVKAYYFPSISS